MGWKRILRKTWENEFSKSAKGEREGKEDELTSQVALGVKSQNGG